MKLEHDFTVHAPPAQAWSVLLDVERVAPCLPGAALDAGGDGTEFAGSMTIKLGPVTSRYRGTVRIEEADEAALRAVLRAQARDARGDGTAAATITTRLEAVPEGTRVRVSTDLAVSGPAAQFGRGVMQDVSGKLMNLFADCLAEELGGGGASVAAGDGSGDGVALTGIEYERTLVGRLPVGPAGDAALAAAAVGRPRERRTADVLDLGAASRAAVAKRALPALAAVALGAAGVVVWLRRRA
jgi:carbon monoxide dehydrogenase subunit G